MRTAVFCLLLGVALPCGAAQPAAFRFYKDVDRGEATQESILTVVLDSDVYDATGPEFPDLRVLDGQDKEVPCLVEKVTETRTHTVHQTHRAEVVSLREQEGGIEVVVRLGPETPAAEGLTLHTPLRNFERRATVFGSEDGSTWKELVGDALVFDYSRYMDVRNQEIRLPKNRCRQLKIVIADITDSRQSPFMELTRKFRGGSEEERVERTTLQRRPLRIDRIETWAETTQKRSEVDAKTEYPVVGFRSEEDPAGKSTIVEVSTRREPLTGFTLQMSSRNFSRLAIVQKPLTRGVRTDWVEVARGRLSLLDFRGFRREQLTIKLPQQRQSQYRIVIHNEDNPPLEITGVKVRGNVYRTVFLAAEDEPYRIYYGAEDVERPKYDLAAVLLPLRHDSQAAEGRLGKEMANPLSGQAPLLNAHSLLNNAFFLGIVICVLAAFLAWGLFHAARRINQLPNEHE